MSEQIQENLAELDSLINRARALYKDVVKLQELPLNNTVQNACNRLSETVHWLRQSHGVLLKQTASTQPSTNT